MLLVSSVAYAASMTGTVKTLGGGSSSVPHCQVLDYDIAASDTITSVNANVECDIGGTYKPTFPIWLNIPLSKSSAFFKPLSICETLAVGMAIITP